MPKFDTRVQELRYTVVKEVAKHIYQNDLMESFYDIPKEIIPGKKPSMRCCVYKERAIIGERIKIIIKSKSKGEGNVIKVIPIACDECPQGGYQVSDACRGCIAHRCIEACPKKCISFDENLRAHIDKSQCINCGLCAKACPYYAIENRVRPCVRACKNKAISEDPETKSALINDEKCIHCGACVYMCPFGAIVDECYIIDIIGMLTSKDKEVYAVVAPSIAGNFTDYKLGQVITSLKKLGFSGVFEAALGADMVALNESKELAEEGELTSSCCPAFRYYIEKNYPTLVSKISHSLSPMATISKAIKENHPNSKIIFIGPCTAKKKEIKEDAVSPYVDSVMTFEELQALIDANNINISELEESSFESPASSFGRGFAKCGGLTSAVNKALEEQNVDFIAKGIVADGVDNIKKALNAMKLGKAEFNFVEGMMCDGGCIGGPCNLTHHMKNKVLVDKYSNEATKEIKTATKGAKV